MSEDWPTLLESKLRESGMSKSSFIKHIGWSPNSFYAIYRGARTPGPDLQKSFCEATGCIAPSFFPGDDSRLPYTRIKIGQEEYYVIQVLAHHKMPTPETKATHAYTQPCPLLYPVKLLSRFPIDLSTLRVVEVRGESMEEEKISDGDYVVYSQGLVRDAGVYVITLADDILVKRLEFDSINRRVIIRSANCNYPDPRFVEEGNSILRIEGRVVTSLHHYHF